MPVEDIRVHVGLTDNPKLARLEASCGPLAFKALIQLWLWIAVNCPKGVLGNLLPAELAAISRWTGDAGKWHDALLAFGWVEKRADGALEIHDWKERQAWVASMSPVARRRRVSLMDSKTLELSSYVFFQVII